MTTYTVVAENHAAASENRIHSDEIASRLGFRGALVPGVAVYGYMTHPLVERFGAQWLSSHQSSVRFLKPAYEGEELRIVMGEIDDRYEVTCHSPRDELLAILDSSMPAGSRPAEQPAVFSSAPIERDRVTIAWDTIDLEHPFPVWHWRAESAGNATYAAQVADRLDIYSRFIHPHWALATANYVLVRAFIMPAWIHVGSEISQYRPFLVDSQIDVQAAPLEKWTRKGHEFVRLCIRYSDAGGLACQVDHTAIYKVAGA